MVVVALSNVRIQWPIAVRPGTVGRSLALNWDLAEAVKRETNRAVCHWWGVTPQTVSKWRKVLGVTNTEATTRWRTKFGKSAKMRKAVEAMAATARDPKRRAKIAATMRGKKRPPALAERLRTMNIGRKHTSAARARMSASQQKRGRRGRMDLQPWTAAENTLVRTLPPIEAAAKIGRTLQAVYVQRSRLKRQL